MKTRYAFFFCLMLFILSSLYAEEREKLSFKGRITKISAIGEFNAVKVQDDAGNTLILITQRTLKSGKKIRIRGRLFTLDIPLLPVIVFDKKAEMRIQEIKTVKKEKFQQFLEEVKNAFIELKIELKDKIQKIENECENPKKPEKEKGPKNAL